ncbi:hypothetical protein KKC60_03915 [Patescibacteria group bacterium]|nr:hypothetical protein [Patescibacteria group bacterium]
MFGQSLLERSQDVLLNNNGRVKIVSFGGGELKGVFELKQILENKAKELNLPSEITIADYSLTKDPGQKGARESGLQHQIGSSVRLRGGFLEIIDIEDAKDADVMISTKGPFEKSGIELNHALAKKVALKLAPGGRTFLEAALIGIPEEEDFSKKLSANLGNEFEVSCGRNDQFAGYIEISRKQKKQNDQL